MRFYLWVRFYETAGATVSVPRPPGVEGWLPVAALMNLKYLLLTASVPVDKLMTGRTPEEVFFQLIPNASSFSHP